MFSSEIKETIYVAISLMLAAAVLGLVAFVLDIRSDFASARNMETATKQSMETYTAFNKYQGQILYGEDVIAIIREYAGTDIAVYVDKLTDEGGSVHPFYVDNEVYKSDLVSFKQLTSIRGLEYGEGPYNPLNGGVKRNTTYFSYLVFGEYGESEITNTSYKDLDDKFYYSDVTAIIIKKVGDGRHSYVTNPKVSNKPSEEECGCKGNTKIYGLCTAEDIYKEVNKIMGK